MEFAADTSGPPHCCAFDPRADVPVAAVTDLAAVGHDYEDSLAVDVEDSSTMRATCLDADEVVEALAVTRELAAEACSHLMRPMAKSISCLLYTSPSPRDRG